MGSRRRFFRFVLVCYGISLIIYWCHRIREEPPLRPPQTEAYVQNFGDLARAVSQETGVPPALILAVGGLESAWGTSELARQGNNHFGIKASPEQPQCCLPTREYKRKRAYTVKACFRAYDHAHDSFRDFAAMLRADERYAPLFRHHPRRYEDWARELQACGYATDPHYAEKLIRLMEKYRLDII